MKLYFAPLEGITTYLYRNAYEKLYGNVDKYFAPFISPAEKCPMTNKEKKDLLPENNVGINLVPQILTCKSEHFNEAVAEIKDMGYREVNLNIGCPSGTVCAKGKGAGFLREPEMLKSFLDDIYSYGAKENISISVKTRLGYADPEEFHKLMEIFNEFPISELIVHARVKTDLYRGEPRLDYYSYAIENSKNPLVYNGNVYSKEDLQNYCKITNCNIVTLMLGRGLITNPGLTNELLTGSPEFDYKKFWEFHDLVYHEYQKILSPDINTLYRMKELWTYWRANFEGSDKIFKHIVKAKKYAEYDSQILKLKNEF